MGRPIFLACCGFTYMRYSRESTGAKRSHCSREMPLPIFFEIFFPFSSRNSSYLNSSGGSPPRIFTIRDDSRAESSRSSPCIS